VGEKIEGVFARQALPMLWDYVELTPFSGVTGDWLGAME
jgi:putative DNA methylase